MGRAIKARGEKERNGESQIYLRKTATDTPMRTEKTRRGLGAGEGGHSNLCNLQSILSKMAGSYSIVEHLYRKENWLKPWSIIEKILGQVRTQSKKPNLLKKILMERKQKRRRLIVMVTSH